jgi:hypothetical protein
LFMPSLGSPYGAKIGYVFLLLQSGSPEGQNYVLLLFVVVFFFANI